MLIGNVRRLAGVVLKIVFTVNDKAEVGKKSPLKVHNIRAGDTDELQPNEVAVNPQDGEFSVIRGSAFMGGGIPRRPSICSSGLAPILLSSGSSADHRSNARGFGCNEPR